MAGQALAADFTISGVVTTQDNAPIENIRVTVKRVQFGDFGNLLVTDIVSGTTLANGQYFLSVPDAGPFRIEFADAATPHRYYREYFDDIVSLAASSEVLIQDGQTSAVANAQLTAIQSITGHVTDESGNPLENIRVSALQQFGDPRLGPVFWLPVTIATTDASGAYLLNAPEPEPIRIEFADASASPRYQTEYYDNATTAWQGSDILFDKDHPAPVIDAQLSIGSVITGRVIDSNGNPIPQATVFAGYPVADEAGQIFLQEGRDTIPDGNGYYTLTLPLSGTVGVGISDQMFPNRFGWQYYQNVKFAQQPTSVTVALGSVTPNINFQIAFFGMISGRVNDKNGNPIENVTVSGYQLVTDTLNNASWQSVTLLASTDANGLYRLPVSDPTVTHICYNTRLNLTEFAPRCYGSTSDDPALASDLLVQEDERIDGIDIQLGAFPRVHGKVTNEQGDPIPFVTMIAHNAGIAPDGTIGIGGGFWMSTTDNNGDYEITGIRASHLVVSAGTSPDSPYDSEWYENQVDPQQSTLFTIELDSVLNLDFQLAKKGNISGTVTNQTGQPLEGISITAFHYYWDGTGGQSWIPFASATSDFTGAYTITQVPVGTYRIGFGLNQDYVPAFYSYTTTVQSATDIVLGLGESAGNIDGTLAPLFRTISGQVTDPTSNPLANITIQLGHNEFGHWIPNGYETTTDVTGSYTLTALPTGSFSLAFIDTSGKFVTEYYDNVKSPIDAQSFAIPTVAPLTNINAQMTGKARIHGTVSGPDGEAISAHSVTLYDAAFNEIAQSQTITDGTYEFSLFGGEYRLCVGTTTVATIYEAECYTDTNPADLGVATPITIENGAEAEINLQLAKKANPNGIINISLNSTPKSIRNLHFSSTVGDFALDDPSLDDGDAFTNVISFEVPSAVYTFTIAMPSDRFLQVVNCEGFGSWVVKGAEIEIALQAGTTTNCAVSVTTGAAIRTFSYHDANGDGMFNEGETPQSGITVTVYIAGSGVLTESISNDDGLTDFANLPPNNLFVVCQNPPTDWANSQPGTIDGQYNSPCYWNPVQGGQLGTIRFGNIEANDPDFTNTPSTSPDGYVITDQPLLNDTNEEGEVQMNLFLPLVIKQ